MNNNVLINKLSQFNLLLFIFMIFFGVLLPSYISIGYWLPKINWYFIHGNYTFIITLLILILATYLVRLLYKIEINKTRYNIIIIFLLVATLLLRILFIINYDQKFSSDFRYMWDYAVDYYKSNVFIPPDSPQAQRPLSSLVPLVFLFGASEITFKAANVFFITIATLISTHLAAKWISIRASIIVFILISLVPETYFASIIPTHDIPGSFYLMICLLLSYKIYLSVRNQKIVFAILYSITLIGFGLLLDIQRDTFYPFVVSSLVFLPLFYTFNKETSGTQLFLILIFAIIIPYLGVSHIKSSLQENSILFNDAAGNDYYNKSHSFCHLNTFTLATNTDCKPFYDTFAKNLDDSDFDYYRKAIAISDLYYNGSERIRNYMGRAQRLYSFGSQGYFYYHNLKGVSEVRQKHITETFKHINTIFATTFVLLLFISTIYLFIIKVYKLGYDSFIYQIVIITSVVTIALLLIGENQPRYLFFCWFLWPIIIASFIDHCLSAHNPKSSIDLAIHKSVYIATFIFAIGLVSVFYLLHIKSEYKLIDMTAWSKVNCNLLSAVACERSVVEFEPTQRDKQFSTLKLMLPEYPTESTFTKVKKEFTVDDNQSYQFSIFAQSPYFRKEKSGSFYVSIIVNGETKKLFNIADSNKYRYFTIKPILPNNGKIVVELQIKSNINYKSASWKKASLVNFKFAALRPYKPRESLIY